MYIKRRIGMIKLIASDVDGTLVPDGTFNINPEIYDIIKKLKEKGIVFAAASGRQYASIKRLFAPVAEDIYYISDNGGFVIDRNDHTLAANAMDKQLVKDIVRDAMKLSCVSIMLAGRDFVYLDKSSEQLYRWIHDEYRFDIKRVEDLTLVDDDIAKVSLYHPSDAEGVVRAWFYDKWQDKAAIACAGVNWVDCNRSDINKGNALKLIMDELHATEDEVMVFGDNINDIGMLRCAKYSYAVGSARQEVKAAARFVADTMANQGVIKTIKKEILNI